MTLRTSLALSIAVLALRPGRYLYTCTVDSHAELGMKGYLRVQS
jgi:uncharacterized cupredoxin-like copper-binding protein